MIAKLAALVAGPGVRIALVLLTHIAAAAGGAWVMANTKNVVIADMRRDQAEENERSTQAIAAAVQAAVRQGDVIAARVAAAETTTQTQLEAKAHEIRRVTSGRPCLGSAAVRLLNQPAGLRPAAVPTAPGQLAEPDATFATDTDVGLWAASARRQYDTCRGRVAAVADFFDGEAQSNPNPPQSPLDRGEAELMGNETDF